MNCDAESLKPRNVPWDTSNIVPKINPDLVHIDETIVGSVAVVEKRGDWDRKELTAFQVWEAIKRHGVSINPVTKIPRYVGLLLKLEEMGLKGNLEAIKLFFDRVVGKQPENLTVNTSHTGALSDRDLLDMVVSVPNQKSIKNEEGYDMASSSQEAGIIEG